MEGALGKPATPVELRVQGEQLRKAPGIILRAHTHAQTYAYSGKEAMQVVFSDSPYGSVHILPQLAKAAPALAFGGLGS